MEHEKGNIMNDKIQETSEDIFKSNLSKALLSRALEAISIALQELDEKTLDFEKRIAHLESLIRQQLYHKGNSNE